LIATLVDNTTEIYDKSFLELNIDDDNLESLKNDAFKNALFYESLKRDNIDNACYLYLLITSNFFSKYNFLGYESQFNLEGLLNTYIDYKFCKNNSIFIKFSNLDKLLLQLGTPQFNKTMEIDHIFPTKGIKVSNRIDRFLNINHIGNLCYLSKRNNQKKSNMLPNLYIEKLIKENNVSLHAEIINNTFWLQVIDNGFKGNLENLEDFQEFVNTRKQALIREIIIKLGKEY